MAARTRGDSESYAVGLVGTDLLTDQLRAGSFKLSEFN